MGQGLQSPTSPLLFVSRNDLASGSLLHRYILKITGARLVVGFLCSLYHYHQSKQGKQKSPESTELQANQRLAVGRQTAFHCDCWGEKTYTCGWDLLLRFDC